MVLLFQGIPLNNYGVECKENSTCKMMSKFPIRYISLCVNFAFILNTLHCGAYRRDGVVKFQTRPQKLHTYATFSSYLCQKLAYCKKSRAQKISRVVPRERRKIVLSFPYIIKIISRLLWPHGTVLQTSATNIQNRKVANYFLDGVVVSGPAA